MNNVVQNLVGSIDIESEEISSQFVLNGIEIKGDFRQFKFKIQK